MVASVDALHELMRKKMLSEAVLKIQVHAGGRGKAGGIIYAKTPDEIVQAGKRLIGMKIQTAQTGPDGVIAHKVMVDTPVAFVKEYYLAVVLDRKAASATLIASKEGGVEIEEVAKNSPDKILREKVPDCRSLRQFQLSRIVEFLGLQNCKKQAEDVIQKMVKLFFELDALLVEINPLVLTSTGALVALDAKMQIDDNALFRHPDIQAMYDPTQLSNEEQKANEHDLAYVALPGTIGCIVNGAGLAMATMDLIHYWKGKPANFLDVGGGASKEKVIQGFQILFNDQKVKAILVNIFGGIMDCDIIAQGLLEAVSTSKRKVPVVVRMEGTNVEKARLRIKESGVQVYTADSLDEAAKLVVGL